MLLHGSTRKQIETEIEGELADCVEDIAQITKQAAFSLLNNELAQATDGETLNILMLEGYAHMTMDLTVHMSSSSIPPDTEMLDRLAMPELSVSISERPQENDTEPESEC